MGLANLLSPTIEQAVYAANAPRTVVGIVIAGLVLLPAMMLDLPLVLGPLPKDIVLLFVTFLVSTVTLGTGRTFVMQGAVHLVLFAAYLFLALVP